MANNFLQRVEPPSLLPQARGARASSEGLGAAVKTQGQREPPRKRFPREWGGSAGGARGAGDGRRPLGHDLLALRPAGSTPLRGHRGQGPKGAEDKTAGASDGSRSPSFPLGRKTQAPLWRQVLWRNKPKK